jgi:hypothetical protein
LFLKITSICFYKLVINYSIKKFYHFLCHQIFGTFILEKY